MTAELAIDLSNCDREPIHQLGAIQSVGFLVAFGSDGQVRYVSENLERFTGWRPEALLDRDLAELVEPDAIHQIRNRLFHFAEADVIERLFGVALLRTRPSERFDCAVHASHDLVVLEASPSDPTESSEVAGLIKAMIGRVDAAQDVPAFLRQGALQVQALTGFDRVMVYRFHPDGSGEVAAEVARGGAASLLGLHFPASDIPRQARALYLRNPFRIICDVEAVAVGIRACADRERAPLDLSLSILRAVSPVHIVYLKNLGVRASLSISIIVDGHLWGMFACHHFAPRCPSFEMRTLAELFAQMFAMKLEARERRVAIAFQNAARSACDGLMAAIAADVSRSGDAEWMARQIGAILPCDGVAVRLNGRTAHDGMTPAAAAIPAIMERVNALADGKIFATDHLAGLGIEEFTGGDDVAGMLAIPVSHLPRDYLLLFRKAKIRSVSWAGDPRKPADGQRLVPRASFAIWREEVRDRCEPFTEPEQLVAETLRASLIEVVLRMADSAGAERQRSTERQELLIAELNHRVRNILALISGLVTQSRDPTISVAAYTDLLEGRIQALSRAHDQITEDNWAPARLRLLFETEGALAMSSGRLAIIGAVVLLDPDAFSTLALVVHELMTNSMKHGALSAAGRVLVDWVCDADGDLHLTWREEGGPAVRAPTRHGLGTTIIERSIPYDLGGTAEISFAPRGFEARFTIPATFVSGAGAEAAVTAPPPGQVAPADAPAPLSGTVLLVEDSLIIAMHVREMLLGLGASDVLVAPTVNEAFEELDRERPSCAILDINLGAETSFRVADRLQGEGVPFIFATGYGKQFVIPPHHAGVRVVQKPYNRANLAEALHR